MKEKFLYLVNKIKELLGFGDPLTSIDLNGAKRFTDLAETQSSKEEAVTEEETQGYVNPNQLGEQALNAGVEETK